MDFWIPHAWTMLTGEPLIPYSPIQTMTNFQDAYYSVSQTGSRCAVLSATVSNSHEIKLPQYTAFLTPHITTFAGDGPLVRCWIEPAIFVAHAHGTKATTRKTTTATCNVQCKPASTVGAEYPQTLVSINSRPSPFEYP